MSTLFFEGFNLKNTDNTIYLDPRYWSRPLNVVPEVTFCELPNFSIWPAYRIGTQGHIKISGYRLDSNPAQSPTPLQLSGVSELNSDKVYISFRVQGLTHNYIYNNTHPYAAKFFTLCNGDSESLSFETVSISGATIQGGSWGSAANVSMGISVKQSGNQIGLFDFRVGGISAYGMMDRSAYHPGGFHPYWPIAIIDDAELSRFVHLEFLIDRTTNIVNLKIEGFDVLNRLTAPYTSNVSGQAFDVINNIKFYPIGITSNVMNTNCSWSYYGLNGGSLAIDDLVIVNNSGANPKTWIGPKSRIYHMKPMSWYGTPEAMQVVGVQFTAGPDHGLADWLPTPSYPGVPNLGSNIITSSDGDNSFISTERSGAIAASRPQLVGDYNSFYLNGIGGIRIYNDVRKTFLDSDFVNVYGTGDRMTSGNYQNIGPIHTVSGAFYDLKNSFIFNNPETNTPWTSGTFFRVENNSVKVSGYFGVKKL
jgi:hypothetical protein